jgi:hypothetical protein
MGKARSRRIRMDSFEGTSTYVSEQNPANLEQAVDAALAAARRARYAPGSEFDVRIWVELREHNQNVKVFGVVATPR